MTSSNVLAQRAVAHSSPRTVYDSRLSCGAHSVLSPNLSSLLVHAGDRTLLSREQNRVEGHQIG